MSRSERTPGNETVSAPSGDVVRARSALRRVPSRPSRAATSRARSETCLSGGQRPRVAFEKCDVRAEAADGHLDGERALPAHRRQRVPDERRLAIPARRDEKDLLRRRQVADEPLELVHAVDECRRGHDFAVDEGVLHYVEQYNRYDSGRNGLGPQAPGAAGASGCALFQLWRGCQSSPVPIPIPDPSRSPFPVPRSLFPSNTVPAARAPRAVEPVPRAAAVRVPASQRGKRRRSIVASSGGSGGRRRIRPRSRVSETAA